MSNFIKELDYRELGRELDRAKSLLEDSRKLEEYYRQECFKRGVRINELEQHIEHLESLK